VRQFRAEKTGGASERSSAMEVLAAARRLNRALTRLAGEEPTPAEAPRLARALRRTARLVQRQLVAAEPVPPA